MQWKNRTRVLLFCSGLLFLALSGSAEANLRITELQYHPLDSMFFQTVVDDILFEFIEIKNTGTQTVDCSGYMLSNGIVYTFPSGTSLPPGGFLVLASDLYWYTARYGKIPNGQYSGKLGNSGETVVLSNASGTILDQVTWSDVSPWPLATDGSGNSLVPRSPDRTGNPNDPATWRASTRIHGSPGADDPESTNPAVVVNEALTHTDPPQIDFVELHNPSAAAVSIGGWFLTDNNADPKKFRIPANTIIPAGGYMVFTDTDFNSAPAAPTSFSLSAHGEEAFIFATDAAGNLTGFNHGFKFGEIENGISFGRYVTSTGAEHFVAQKSVSQGAANSEPVVGPVVISEIMYGAPAGQDFLEIVNISGAAVPLYDPQHPTNTWKIDGITFSFPANTVINPGQIILFADDTITVDAFRSLYSVPASVLVYSYSGKLKDEGETIRLDKAESPFIKDTSIVVPYMLIDWISYLAASPWPGDAFGTGKSIQRKDCYTYGNDPANWTSGLPTPGSAPVGIAQWYEQDTGHRPQDGYTLNVVPGSGGNLALSFDLDRAEKVGARFFDVSGRLLWRAMDEVLQPGIHKKTLKMPNAVSGLLILEIMAGDQKIVKTTLMPLR